MLLIQLALTGRERLLLGCCFYISLNPDFSCFLALCAACSRPLFDLGGMVDYTLATTENAIASS
jgi:hypothetical protein